MTNPQRSPMWFGNDSEQDDVGKANSKPHDQRDQVRLLFEVSFPYSNKLSWILLITKVFLGDASPSGTDTNKCLTAPQVDALRQIYQPLFGTSGQLLYPRFDPGAEAYGSFQAALNGAVFPIVAVSAYLRVCCRE